MSLILADARRAMAKRVRENQAVAAAQAPRTHSMADLVMNALNGHPEGVPGELDHPNVALPSPEYLGPPQATPAHPQVAVVVPNQEPPALEKTLTTDVPSLTPPKLPEVSPAPVKPVVAVSALPVLSPTGSLLVPKLPEPVPVDATPDVHPIPTLTPPSPPEKPAASLPLAEGAWMAGSSLPSTAAAGASGVAMPAAGATDQPSAVIAPPQGIPIDPLPTPSQGLTSTKNGMASEGGPSSYHTTGAPESNGAVAGGATSTPTLLPARTPPYEAMGTPAPFQPGTVAASPGGATAAYHPAASEWRPMPTPSPNATRLPPGLGLPQLLSILTTSDYPSQREAAADALGAVDWRLHPEVVTCLTRAARQDAVPMVRVQCIRSLVRLNVSGTMVASTFQYLQVDVDPQVRREARQALTQVSAGRPLSAAPGMDPAQPQGTGWSIMGN